MNFYKILIGILTFLYALFIFTFPPSFYNDDALFLVRGVENYSIIDFSPHFPGYPFIILFGKFINFFINDSVLSIFILSALCGIFLPLVLFLYVKKISNENNAFIVFLLSLSSPYLMNLSLSMLSDSVGLFFIFLALYTIELGRSRVSGIILAIAFFSRPSYIVFYLAGLIYLYIKKRDTLKVLVIWFLIGTAFFLTYIFFSNGLLYLYEAKRFLLGHFTLWGTGQNSDINWFDNIFTLVNLPFVFLLQSFYRFDKNYRLLYVLFGVYLFWIIFAQNPDNLRHLIPLVFISTILISESIKNSKILISLILCLNIYTSLSFTKKISPIDQIIKKIDEPNRIIISNRSIEILRNNLDNSVSDHYYVENSKFILENKKTYHISTKKPSNGLYKVYKGRFIGEHTFYLSKNQQ